MNILKIEKVNLFIRAVACALVFTAAISLVSFEASCDEIRQNVLRLHIKANSDSESDQNLKLLVRDAILEVSEQVFSGCDSVEKAYTCAADNVTLFQETAETVIKSNGYDYSVSVDIGTAWFETREYENFTLPAGTYEAVRINIGSGEGKNWWCVMFPSLCIPSAKSDDAKQVLGEENEKIVSKPDRYEVRFKTVEIFEKLKQRLSKIFAK